MVNPRETQALQPWADDGSESIWDNDVNENELVLDDLAADTKPGEGDENSGSGTLAPWQRIEIARENKRLQSILEDFDEYDEFEHSQDNWTAEYSH